MYNPYQNFMPQQPAQAPQQPAYMQPWTQPAPVQWQQPPPAPQPEPAAPIIPQPPQDLAQAIYRLCDILEAMHAKEVQK